MQRFDKKNRMVHGSPSSVKTTDEMKLLAAPIVKGQPDKAKLFAAPTVKGQPE